MSLDAENITEAPAANPGEATLEAAPILEASPAETQRASKRFDFRHPVFLSSGEWRKIRAEVEEFTESLGALLSTYLRLDFGMQLARLETGPFNEFTAALPAATHLTMFKLEPLRGVSVMEVSPGIGLGMVDRMLGGPGKPASLSRTLTEMEVALMDQLVQLVLGEWCKQWRRVQEMRAEILAHESNPRFLQSSSGDTVLLLVTLDARMGECTGQIQLAIPYAAFEPLLNKIAEAGAPAPAPAAAATPFKWNRTLDQVPIALKAQWPSFRLKGRQLLAMKVGEVLDLQPLAAERVELKAGKMTKFRGRLGTREGKWAVQITEVSKL